MDYAKELMHGKSSLIHVKGESVLFRHLPDEILAARYHSLSARKETLPENLRVTAVSQDGEVMAVEHRQYPVYGVQFHPESVMTPEGKVMVRNFLDAADQFWKH